MLKQSDLLTSYPHFTSEPVWFVINALPHINTWHYISPVNLYGMQPTNSHDAYDHATYYLETNTE